MKLLPIIMEQSISKVEDKLNYFIKNHNQVLVDTNQGQLSFGVYVICPSFSSIHNVPSTISLSTIFEESGKLVDKNVNLYINYLATAEDMMVNVPETMNYEFLPTSWNVRMYVPLDILHTFKIKSDNVDELGGLIYLRELNQQTLDNFKTSGCYNFSLLGKHIVMPGVITDEEVDNIIKIITDNSDCQFIVNSEMEKVIEGIANLSHVQMCMNKNYWSNKIEN